MQSPRLPCKQFACTPLLQLLGVSASKADIAAMLAKAGADEASELDPEAFNRVMTEVLTSSGGSGAGAAAAVRCACR